MPAPAPILDPFLSLIVNLWYDLTALVWPVCCAGCGAPDRDCCAECRARVRAPAPVLRRDIGVPCFARGAYDGPLRALLVAYKHAGRAGFARLLSPELRGPLEEAIRRCAGPDPPIVVCAPSRRERVRERGYRHVELLVTGALRARSGRAALPARRVAALRAMPGRSTQVGLSAGERARNARRVAVRRSAEARIHGREVILVDDVVTTGATALAAREVLESAGARVVAVAALCIAVRRDSPSERRTDAERDTREGEPGGNTAEECSRVRERRLGAPHWPPA